jgi:hypothetical protein
MVRVLLEAKASSTKEILSALEATSFNSLKPTDYYMYQLIFPFSICACYIHEPCTILSVNSISQLIFVMAKCDVFFEVWTEFLNII